MAIDTATPAATVLDESSSSGMAAPPTKQSHATGRSTGSNRQGMVGLGVMVFFILLALAVAPPGRS